MTDAEYRKKVYQCPMCGAPGPISQADYDNAIERLSRAPKKAAGKTTGGSSVARMLLRQDTALREACALLKRWQLGECGLDGLDAETHAFIERCGKEKP